MSQGQKNQLDIAAGQNELFSASESILQSNISKKLIKISPSNKELVMERKVLGYYMSKHPMESYLNELNDMNIKNILSINNYIIDNSITKLNTTISGVIIDSRIQKIGKNKYLNIFKVDDGSGFINASFFEEKYLTYKHLIKEDVILFFHGETLLMNMIHNFQ